MPEPSLCRMRHSSGKGRIPVLSDCMCERPRSNTHVKDTVESGGLTRTRKGYMKQGNPDMPLALREKDGYPHGMSGEGFSKSLFLKS